MRSSAEMLFAERNEALRRSPSKESTSQEEDGNEGSNSTSPDLTQSTNSVDRFSFFSFLINNCFKQYHYIVNSEV